MVKISVIVALLLLELAVSKEYVNRKVKSTLLNKHNHFRKLVKNGYKKFPKPYMLNKLRWSNSLQKTAQAH